MKIKKVLIANRGEIAIRIIRTCRVMGLESVAIYSEADRESLHVMLADKAYYVGGAISKDSYLNIERIIKVAKEAKVHAIHPGYGFLSESPDFAKAVEDSGLIFIGASSESIRDMGDKIQARKIAEKAGIPVIPGTQKALKDEKQALEMADEIGYPVILKASAGGGGRGIRVVTKNSEMKGALFSCQQEGEKFFNDGRIFIEKYIESPKHIEVQILADQHGHAVHLFERECSIQRRHQKIIEESPSPLFSNELREKVCQLALKLIAPLKYKGAGTVEFILDQKTDEVYFMEMNTRLQVEHPITEMITGVDLVKQQILIAMGERLSLQQENLNIRGHAIELRICAENPVDFTPSPGLIRRYRMPHGAFVRVDGYGYAGYNMPVYYDSLLAKLICWGESREDCLMRVKAALSEFMITGIQTNVNLHRNILSSKRFLDGTYNTRYLDEEFKGKSQHEFFMFVHNHIFIVAAALAAYEDRRLKSARSSEVNSLWRELHRKDRLE